MCACMRYHTHGGTRTPDFLYNIINLPSRRNTGRPLKSTGSYSIMIDRPTIVPFWGVGRGLCSCKYFVSIVRSVVTNPFFSLLDVIYNLSIDLWYWGCYKICCLLFLCTFKIIVLEGVLIYLLTSISLCLSSALRAFLP